MQKIDKKFKELTESIDSGERYYLKQEVVFFGLFLVLLSAVIY